MIAAAAAPGTLGEHLDAAVARLKAAGITEARLDAELLLAHVLGTDRWRLRFRRAEPLAAAAADRFEALVAGRAARRPVSRLLGRREFWSLDFVIDDAVLDPRPDSETLVEAALELLPERDARYRLLDLGVGSGCLLLALLRERPAAVGVGVDRSLAAICTARRNALRLGLGDRACFAVADWGAALAPAGFDVVVTNPPYIAGAEFVDLAPEVRLADPVAALDGGPDGLEAYRAIAPQLPRLLRPGGFAVLEHGAGQGPAVATAVEAAGLTIRSRRRDLGGNDRCVVATFRCRDAVEVKIALGKRPD